MLRTEWFAPPAPPFPLQAWKASSCQLHPWFSKTKLEWMGQRPKKNFSSLCIKTQLTFTMQHLCSAHVKLRIVLSSKNKTSSHKSRHALSKLTERKDSSTELSQNLGKYLSCGLKKKKRHLELLQCCRPAMQYESAAGTWIKRQGEGGSTALKKSKGDFHYRQCSLSSYRVPHWFCTLHACSFMVLWF